MGRNELTGTTWDVIVVGTGMGGATAGYALAKAGKRVLFLERGRSAVPDGSAVLGQFAETFMAQAGGVGGAPAEVLRRAGRWTEAIEDRSRRRWRRFVPFLGAGTGGSSALFGMTCERLHPADFTPRRNFLATDAADLPEAWPISYDDLRPYYRQAEALFRVRGDLDPLRGADLDPLLPPPALSAEASQVHALLAANGLHPYQPPLACEQVAGCQVCQGYLCANDCKNDSARICLRPAVSQNGATLVTGCGVEGLEADRTKVTGVVCRRGNERLTLRAKVVVLAAGALTTPCLLLRSASPHWPTGLANKSGLVGRNLMRHYIDLYPVNAGAGAPSARKDTAFNDLYIDRGGAAGKLGTIQSFGALPPAVAMLAELEQDIKAGAAPWAVPALRLLKPILEVLITKRFARATVLAAIMEDLPFPENRVRLDGTGSGIVIEYRIRPAEAARIALMRSRMRRLLKPARFALIKQAENNARLAHVCGTCRFGVDPARSVLDADNRCHGLGNLFVVDSSFFPSSAGVNPALTIAANALRVAERVAAA